jgi:SPP1 gp7 family putative phage head morphogenesis protein
MDRKNQIRKIERLRQQFEAVYYSPFQEILLEDAELINGLLSQSKDIEQFLLLLALSENIEVQKKFKSIYQKMFDDVIVNFAQEEKSQLIGIAKKRLKKERDFFIENYVAKKVNNVSDTTRIYIQKLVIKAQEKNMGLTEIQSLISEKLGNQAKNRALTIVRTEIASSSSYSQLAYAKASGRETKEWLDSNDSHVRKSHQAMDGEKRKLNEYFSNGLQYPSDPNGLAAEIINCRCSLLFY